VAHFVIGLKTASWSISWNASVSSKTRGLEPPTAIMGAASTNAFATPVTRLVAPGPDAPMHTPGFRVTRL